MQMCAALAANGHQVVLHAKCRDQDTDASFTRYAVPPDFRISASWAGTVPQLSPIVYGLMQALKARFRYKSDVCYARCLLSAFFASLLGMTVVVELHEVPHSKPLRLLVGRLLNSANVKRCVVISEGLLADVQSAYPEAVGRGMQWLVAHDGANLPDTAQRFELSGTVTGCQVGYAGGLRAGNGIELVLRLAQRFPMHEFHIMGGKAEEIEHWKSLQRSQNITWYGQREPRQVASFLLACDVLLAPYQHGPKTAAGRDTSRWMSPLKVFEYMASGRPMVISDFPVLREVLRDDIAIIVDPEGFELWVQAVDKLAQNPALRTEMGKGASLALEEKYTWKVRAKAVVAGLEAQV